MGKETKPNSRIIQITTNICEIEELTPMNHKYKAHKTILIALCEDGSLWEITTPNKEWGCILEAGYDKKEPDTKTIINGELPYYTKPNTDWCKCKKDDCQECNVPF